MKLVISMIGHIIYIYIYEKRDLYNIYLCDVLFWKNGWEVTTEGNFIAIQVSNNKSNYMIDTRIIVDLFFGFRHANVSITKSEA